MSLSLAVPLIKEFEGCRLKAYLCPAGIPTIGWGATGPDVFLGLVWSQEQADSRLLLDAGRAEREVKRLVARPLAPHQLAALTSFVFNLGPGAFAKSTLLRRLKAGETDVGAEFDKWVKARVGGRLKTLPGLVKRRAAERAMFEGR